MAGFTATEIRITQRITSANINFQQTEGIVIYRYVNINVNMLVLPYDKFRFTIWAKQQKSARESRLHRQEVKNRSPMIVDTIDDQSKIPVLIMSCQ